MARECAKKESTRDDRVRIPEDLFERRDTVFEKRHDERLFDSVDEFTRGSEGGTAVFENR